MAKTIQTKRQIVAQNLRRLRGLEGMVREVEKLLARTGYLSRRSEREAVGKVIVYRAPCKDETIYSRPTFSIKTSFAKCLVDAGITDSQGRPWGSPNALRHTIHTYLQTVGVPQAHIDAAAGHVTDGGGTGKNYTHLRPEYLKDFVAAVEAYWEEMNGLTRVHRSQVGPKVYDLAERRSAK